MVLSGPCSVASRSRWVYPATLTLPAAPWAQSINGEPMVQVSCLAVLCGEILPPWTPDNIPGRCDCPRGLGCPWLEARRAPSTLRGMGHLPQRMVLPGVFLVAAMGPALDLGEGEAGFEAGALASELRPVHPVDPLRAGLPGSPVYRVLFLASLTSPHLLRSAFCVQGAKGEARRVVEQWRWENHAVSPCSRGQFSSVAQSCLTLCDPMDCSTPGLPVHHQLPELTRTHVH